MNDNYTILIQEVKTIWGKNERGGEGATVRNTAPETVEVPLPFKVASEPTYVINEVEWDFGTSKIEVEKAWKPFTYKNHTIYLLDSAIEVVFPFRIKDNKKHYFYVDNNTKYLSDQQGLLTVQPNEWVQFLYNERHRNFPDHGNRTWYEKWVINIGLFLELTPDVFTKTPPKKIVSQLKMIR